MHQECMHVPIQEHLLQAKITLKIFTLKFSVFVIFHSLRWLPRVITNIVLIERELENET